MILGTWRSWTSGATLWFEMDNWDWWTNCVVVMDHRLGATLPAVRNDEVLEKEKRICNFVSEVGSP